MHEHCKTCFDDQTRKLVSRYHVPEELAADIHSRIFRIIENDANLNPAQASGILHRMMKKVTGVRDPYREEKTYYNTLLLEQSGTIRKEIQQAADPFLTALRYAVTGNIIDFGPPRKFDVHQALSQAASVRPVIDHSEALRSALQEASTVLYLGDNAGEIVMDKLFIETIGHPNLYFAVRGQPVINDITLEDAALTGMHQAARVITNGFDAPSTLLNRCSREFMDVFERADVIISKGQGNFEGLMEVTRKRIFFLLMVKCRVISEIVGVPEGSVVVMDGAKHLVIS